MANSIASAQVTVTASPTRLTPTPAAGAPYDMIEIVVYNPGPLTVAIGGPTVATTDGNIPVGGALKMELGHPDDIPYGVATGSQIVHVFRQRLEEG